MRFEIIGGDTQGLIDAINMTNASGGPSTIIIQPDEHGMREFIFDGPADGFGTALPTITADTSIITLGGRVTFKASEEVEGEFWLLKYFELQVSRIIIPVMVTLGLARCVPTVVELGAPLSSVKISTLLTSGTF